MSNDEDFDRVVAATDSVVITESGRAYEYSPRKENWSECKPVPGTPAAKQKAELYGEE